MGVGRPESFSLPHPAREILPGSSRRDYPFSRPGVVLTMPLAVACWMFCATNGCVEIGEQYVSRRRRNPLL